VASVAASNRLQLARLFREPRGFDFLAQERACPIVGPCSGPPVWGRFSATEARRGRYTFLNEVDGEAYLFVGPATFLIHESLAPLPG